MISIATLRLLIFFRPFSYRQRAGCQFRYFVQSSNILVPPPRKLCFHRRLMFVSLLTGLRNNYSTDFRKFGGKMAREPQKKPLHFGGNPDHVIVRVSAWLRLRLVGARTDAVKYCLHGWMRSFNTFCDISGLGGGMRSR